MNDINPLWDDIEDVIPWIRPVREAGGVSLPDALKMAAIELFVAREYYTQNSERIREALERIRGDARK